MCFFTFPDLKVGAIDLQLFIFLAWVALNYSLIVFNNVLIRTFKKKKKMKQLNIVQSKQSIMGLFAEPSRDPVLVKNQTGHYFLVLPLAQKNWQELFFHLYQLPENIFVQQNEIVTKYDNIDAVCGSMKGLLSSSQEFARNKQEEIELEQGKWKI